MKNYYVNNIAQPSGDHEVHEKGCVFMPSNRKDLGKHSDCQSAVEEAKLTYTNADGCFHCSYECHTS
jgi:hypothetical protein